MKAVKIFRPDINKCNLILRNSGYTGMLRWNCPGFDSAWCRSLIFLEASFFFFQHCKDIFIYFYFLNIFFTVCFLLVINVR
jgi:hypothetical protein